MTTRSANRPESRSYTVQRLVELVADGLVRVPEWQRLFKWKSKHIRELLDSIARGYPVGTLLLWKRPGSVTAGRVAIGPHAFDAPESSEALWIVDGQQRVTTLAGVLMRRGAADRPPSARDIFTWAYDLATDRWRHPGANEAWRDTWLPADRLVDVTDLVTWLGAHGHELTPEQQARANALARDVREFELPAIVVRAESDEALREIFDRTNNAGVRLRIDETFDALQGSLISDQPSTIRRLAQVPVELGFGELDPEWLLRLLVQVSGGDWTRVSRKTLERTDLAQHLPATAVALRRAIVFMRREAGIANAALLPYRLPLVALSVFYARHPEPRPRSLDLLARWVWRGAVSGEHRGASVPAVRALFDAIGDDEEASVQVLLRLAGAPRFSGLSRLDTRTAATRLELLGLLSLAPRALDGGAAIDGAALILERRSRALQTIVSTPEARAMPVGRSLANRILHPPGTRQLAASLASSDPDIAASHAIDAEAQALLRAERYSEFLEARARDLEIRIRRFLDARMRLDEPDRPSIESMIVADPA